MKIFLFAADLIAGILFVLMGIGSFAYPMDATLWLSMVFGILMIVTGVCDAAMYSRLSKAGMSGAAVSLVSGILCIITGVLVLFNPFVGVFTLMALFPIWFMFHCISRIAVISAMRDTISGGRYALALVLYIIGIILSFILMVNPEYSLISLSWMASIIMIIIGIDLISDSVRVLKW